MSGTRGDKACLRSQHCKKGHTPLLDHMLRSFACVCSFHGLTITPHLFEPIGTDEAKGEWVS